MKHLQAHQVKTRECIFSTDNQLTGRLKKQEKNFVCLFLSSWRNLRFGGEYLEVFALMMLRGDEVGGGLLLSHRFSCRYCQINAEINLYVLDYLTETIDEFSSLELLHVSRAGNFEVRYFDAHITAGHKSLF